MKIAVLGTGMVGQALAARLVELGHDVVVGTRDPEATLGRTEPDGMGSPPFSAWLEAHSVALQLGHPQGPRSLVRRKAGHPVGVTGLRRTG